MSDAQFATFTLADHVFGVEVESVQEVIRYQPMTRVPLAPGAVSGLINLRGQVITALDLRTRLGLPSRAEDVQPMNVVVRTDDGAVSLLVDRIGDVIELDDEIEPLPDTITGPRRDLVLGTLKLEDRLMLALDVAKATETDSRI